MLARRFDCVVIGAGPAGVAAAARLARGGLSVVALEAGAFPGAENWSGAVYFTENLEHPTVFGGPAIEAAPYERRVARRGIYAYDGSAMLGARFTDRAAFHHSYTVLRPIYDRYLAEQARALGALILDKTTAQSLIRRDGKVVGAMTSRGPVYADVVFLAEGDASHLVTQEGYERAAAHPPRFLQGVKEVLRLPPEVIERRFGLAGDEGACFEFLIRNATRHGRTARLNAGGFLYTNRDSVSLGFVLPLDNLRDCFDGQHHTLIEWVKSLPVVKGWIEGATSASYGTKIIRGGGAREMPTLVDHGLAIGGAASGIGLDFPYPNFTGPATAMGQLFADAVLQLRREGAELSRENLVRAYLAPLERTHYVANVRALEAWPDYVERTTEMFASQVDLAGGIAEALTEPEWSPPRRAWEAVRAVRRFSPPLADAARDHAMLSLALGLPRLVLAGLSPRCWPHWIANIVRQLVPARAPDSLAIELLVPGRASAAAPPWPVRWVWGRFRGALDECFRHVYTNDRTPLATKLARAASAVSRRASLTDLVLVPLALVMFGVAALVQRAAEWWAGSKPTEDRAGWWARRAKRLRGLLVLDDGKVGGEGFEAKLARNSYDEAHASHIKVLWPTSTHEHGELAVSPLWSLCPAKVYERTAAPGGLPLVAVSFDNCIKCESCWRATPDVHWSRATSQGLVFETYAPAQVRLFEMLEAAPAPHPRLPGGSTWGEAWIARARDGVARGGRALAPADAARARACTRELAAARDDLDRATAQLSHAIDREPRALDRTRLDWLVELTGAWEAPLARLAGAADRLAGLGLAGQVPTDSVYELLRDLAVVVATARRHATDAKPFWAELLGRQIRAHHLEGVRLVATELDRALGAPAEVAPAAVAVETPHFEQPLDARTAATRAALAQCFTTAQIRALEAGEGLVPAARALLEDLRSGARGDADVAKVLFELARVDPSVAYAVASDVHARRLLAGPGQPLLAPERGRWLATARAGAPNLVPALLADHVVVCASDGVRTELLAAAAWAKPCRPTGLRGADLVAGTPPDAGAVSVDAGERWTAAAAGLLAAVCRGAVDYLLERSVDHASARVQFATAFSDELGNSGIAKFGAVKQLLAQIAMHGYALDCARALHGFVGVDPAEARVAERVLAALAFGPHEGSAAYNAGQVFGGTAISEDDVLAKYYRDSSPFRYLWGGIDEAAASLAAYVRARGRDRALAGPDASVRARVAATGILGGALARWDAAALHLGAAFARLDAPARTSGYDPADARLGVAYAGTLAAAAMIVRTQRLLEQGEACRMEVQATRLAADALADQVRACVDDALRAFDLAALGALALEGAMLESAAASVSVSYADVMHAKPAFRSGQYLTAPLDRNRVRYTPELRAADPALAAFDGRMSDYFRTRYYEADYAGMSYGRYLESRHQLADDDVAGMHREGFLKVYIPQALGGLGLPKSYYYAMVEQSMRWADPSWTLVVMGNSSIGTTPIQIGLHQDLPRAVKELERVKDDPAYLGDIAHALEELAGHVGDASDAEVGRRLDAIAALVAKRIDGGAILKYLAKGFTKPLRAALAARSIDERGALAGHLAQARDALLALGPMAVRRLDEFPRRARAHELFLKLIAHGQMSAFALTEPTAGSDSGGVKTLARYAQRRLERSARGEWVFYLDEKTKAKPRVLLDADRLVFENAAVFYRHEDGAAPAALRFDAYDYATDGTKTRYYVHAGHRYEFHDIGQIRTDEAGPYWAFYELTGTKMWITNGRICGVMCLYAKTPEGVTGFMVDRHAEGLVVGNDEEKLGQQGSPTNELSLAGVRVAAENLIGYAGRGQVNALETLNVGRGGLCVSCAGIERDIIHRAIATMAGARPGPRERCELGRIVTEWVTTQSIAHELVGLFDAKAADAVRVESAIGKYWASESLHRAIGYEEDLRGLYGATDAFDVEKKRRDARVLNIYEGTNEVQRFLLLKDLSSYLLERYRAEGPVAPRAVAAGATDRELVLERAKDRLFAATDAISRQRGDAAWANASYQPTYFRLAEVAGQIKIADALEYRLLALARAGGTDSSRGRAVVAALELALLRVHDGLERAFARFELSNGYLERELYPPEVQLGFQLLERAQAAAPCTVDDVALELDHPIEVAVVVSPRPRVAPVPRIAHGQLREPSYELSDTDQGALAVAAQIARRAGGKARVTAVAVARPVAREVLTHALALGAHRAWLVPARVAHPAGAEVGGALLAAFDRRGYRPDLVLVALGDDPASGAPGLGAYLAAALEVPLVSGASRVTAGVAGGALELALDAGGTRFARRLPAVVALEPGESATGRSLPCATLSALVDAAGMAIETIDVAGERDLDVELRPATFAAAAAVRRATDADGAAAAFLALAERLEGGARASRPVPLATRPQPFDRQDTLSEPAVLAWLAHATSGELSTEAMSVALRARDLARAWGSPLDVALPLDLDAGAEPALAGTLAALGPRRVYLVRQPGIARFSWAGHLVLARRFLDEYAGALRALVGPASLEPVLAQVARRHRGSYWFGVDAVENGVTPPRLVTRILDGRAHAVARPSGSGLLVVSARAGRSTWPVPAGDVRCEVFADRLPLDYDPATDPMARPTGAGGELTLSNAEYVVDVGYALKTADDLARVALPLERLLVSELGLAKSVVGATRKVTQDLKILPMDRQIGQTGVRVAPKALFALGVSGAPQHVDYIDPETVVFCFNMDPDSPLMQWNKDKPRPLVHPIAGDLFETVPRFIAAVRRLAGGG